MSIIVCPHCKSSWNSSATVSQCPFCKKPLIKQDKNNNSYSDMLTLLKDVRQEFGIEVFSNTGRTLGILKDKAPKLKKDIDLFAIILNSGLCTDFWKHSGDKSYLIEVKKARFKLSEETNLDKSRIDAALNWICALLNIPLIESEGTQNQAGAPVSKPFSVMNQDRYPSVAAVTKSDEEKRRRSLINEEDTSYSMNSSVESYTPGYTEVDEPEPKTESVDSEQKAADENKLSGKDTAMGVAGCLFFLISGCLAVCAFSILMATLFSGFDGWAMFGYLAGAAVVSYIIAGLFDKKK